MAGISHAYATSTAAMGKMVLFHLRVYGITGLGVADASTFPVAIAGITQATLYRRAVQVVDMTLQDN